MGMKNRNRGKVLVTYSMILWLTSFGLGMLFSNRMRADPQSKDHILYTWRHLGDFTSASDDCVAKKKLIRDEEVMKEFRKAHEAIQSLDSSVAKLRLELPSNKMSCKIGKLGNATSISASTDNIVKRKKDIYGHRCKHTFSSLRRRDSVRETWMPRGKSLHRLEQEKGIVVLFMVGHSATSNSILDRAIDSEDAQNNDFLRLEHVEGYHELSAKTKSFFTTAVERWDAEFYVKVDDEVHVNLGILNVKYHEPEYWKFGEEGNNYFRHAPGQIYAISRDLAKYISINQQILHKYANEDVSLGDWLIGLEVEHVNDRSMCCGILPECEWKAQAGNFCVASFEWSCSGICKSLERIKGVHAKCAEDASTLWNALV